MKKNIINIIKTKQSASFVVLIFVTTWGTTTIPGGQAANSSSWFRLPAFLQNPKAASTAGSSASSTATKVGKSVGTGANSPNLDLTTALNNANANTKDTTALETLQTIASREGFALEPSHDISYGHVLVEDTSPKATQTKLLWQDALAALKDMNSDDPKGDRLALRAAARKLNYGVEGTEGNYTLVPRSVSPEVAKAATVGTVGTETSTIKSTGTGAGNTAVKAAGQNAAALPQTEATSTSTLPKSEILLPETKPMAPPNPLFPDANPAAARSEAIDAYRAYTKLNNAETLKNLQDKAKIAGLDVAPPVGEENFAHLIDPAKGESITIDPATGESITKQLNFPLSRGGALTPEDISKHIPAEKTPAPVEATPAAEVAQSAGEATAEIKTVEPVTLKSANVVTTDPIIIQKGTLSGLGTAKTDIVPVYAVRQPSTLPAPQQAVFVTNPTQKGAIASTATPASAGATTDVPLVELTKIPKPLEPRIITPTSDIIHQGIVIPQEGDIASTTSPKTPSLTLYQAVTDANGIKKMEPITDWSTDPKPPIFKDIPSESSNSIGATYAKATPSEVSDAKAAALGGADATKLTAGAGDATVAAEAGADIARVSMMDAARSMGAVALERAAPALEVAAKVAGPAGAVLAVGGGALGGSMAAGQENGTMGDRTWNITGPDGANQYHINMIN